MKKIETDFLIVGGGAAGFAAALEATAMGMRVVLLEKTAEIGGSSAMSGGCLAFAGTDLQQAAGIEDSSEMLKADLIEVGKHENDAALVDTYVAHQLDTYRWLRQHGVEFDASIEASSGQSRPRVHTVDPADMVRALAKNAKASGLLDVLMSTRAMRLLRKDEAAPVTGVRAEGPDGPLEIFSRTGVLLASGGFVHDKELVHQYAPQYAEAVFIGGEGNVGDGFRMACKLGAGVRDMAYIKGTFGKHPVDMHNNHSLLAVYKGAIAVNQDGQRFVDESISYKLLGDAVMRQPYYTGYQIFDQPIFDSGDDRVRILDINRRLQEGLLIQADTLAALAGQIEIDAQVLQDTVQRYNAMVDKGVDEDYGRTGLVQGYGALRRIETGPFYAYPSTAAVFGTYCGVHVDTSLHVIDVFGEPIAGLYAAGEMIGGFHGAAYMTGSALGKAVVFGRLAARTASAARSAA
jgi:fumarate reductase flavoprotein subunit